LENKVFEARFKQQGRQRESREKLNVTPFPERSEMPIHLAADRKSAIL
jgi:hypothetical protein